MNRHALQLLLCFLAGLVTAAAVQWSLNDAPIPGPLATAPPAALPAPDAVPASAADDLIVAVPFDGPRPGNPERARKLIAAALPVIRKCDPQERAARWELILQQLREEGDARFEALAAFLATGEDLPTGPPLQLPGLRVDGPASLREAALNFPGLFNTPAGKELRIRESKRSLESAQTAGEALRYARMLEYTERGAHREAIIAAMRRLGADPDAANAVTQTLWRFRAAELLPLAEAGALAQPKENLPDLIGALWRMPPAIREETTERLLANPAAHSAMADSLHRLDYRLPRAREFAVAWITGAAPPSAKAEVIRKLGEPRNWGPRPSFPGDEVHPDASVGTPGTPAQAEARLSLIEQLIPHCPEPFLQEQLAATRAALERQFHGKR